MFYYNQTTGLALKEFNDFTFNFTRKINFKKQKAYAFKIEALLYFKKYLSASYLIYVYISYQL